MKEKTLDDETPVKLTEEDIKKIFYEKSSLLLSKDKFYKKIKAMDPTVKVALIAAGALVLTNAATLVVTVMIHKSQREMKVSVDGNFSRVLDTNAEIGKALADKSDQLSRAEGRREGSDSERARKGEI